MNVMGRRRLGRRADIEAGHRPDKCAKARLHLDDRRRGGIGQEGREADEMQRVAEPLLAMQQQAPAVEMRAVPFRVPPHAASTPWVMRRSSKPGQPSAKRPMKSSSVHGHSAPDDDPDRASEPRHSRKRFVERAAFAQRICLVGQKSRMIGRGGESLLCRRCGVFVALQLVERSRTDADEVGDFACAAVASAIVARAASARRAKARPWPC